MNITDIERTLLLNQYEILKRLAPDEHEKADCDLKISALSDGYDEDFEEMLGHLPEPLDPQVKKEVRDILEMFRALGPRDGGRIPAAARFVGFDGNEETQHYAYAEFLVEECGRWGESRRDDYNTHSPVLHDYREMLKKWEATGRKFDLTKEEVEAIVASAPYGSVDK